MTIIEMIEIQWNQGDLRNAPDDRQLGFVVRTVSRPSHRLFDFIRLSPSELPNGGGFVGEQRVVGLNSTGRRFAGLGNLSTPFALLLLEIACHDNRGIYEHFESRGLAYISDGIINIHSAADVVAIIMSKAEHSNGIIRLDLNPRPLFGLHLRSIGLASHQVAA
jgi:hypothetical protein